MHNPNVTLESLQNELDALKKENAELRQQLEARGHRTETREEGAMSRDEQRIPYREIFEVLSVPVSVYRSDGLQIALNRANCAQAGVTPEQIIGRYNLLEDPHARDMGFSDHFRRAIAGETVAVPPTFYDIRQAGIGVHEGRSFWTQTTYLPIEGLDGERYVVEVNIDVTEQERARLEVREREELIRGILEDSPIILFVKDIEGRYTMASRRAQELMGLDWNELKGKTDLDVFPRDIAESYRAADQHGLSTPGGVQYTEQLPTDKGIRDVYTVKFRLLDANGKPTGVCGISTDITDRKRAEEDNRKLQDEMMRVRDAALRALSTPLIPIAKGVLVMPLIGDIDQERSRQVLETLLHGVSQSRARVAILDVTGVTSAGPEVADGLIQAARAVRLLGAQVVRTVIQPTMAQTLATMREGLGDLVTRGTLEGGVDYAMRMLRG